MEEADVLTQLRATAASIHELEYYLYYERRRSVEDRYHGLFVSVDMPMLRASQLARHVVAGEIGRVESSLMRDHHRDLSTFSQWIVDLIDLLTSDSELRSHVNTSFLAKPDYQPNPELRDFAHVIHHFLLWWVRATPGVRRDLVRDCDQFAESGRALLFLTSDRSERLFDTVPTRHLANVIGQATAA